MCRPVSLLGFDIFTFRQLTEEVLVFPGQPGRDPDIDPDKLVAPAVSLKMRDTLIAHPEDLARLSAGFDFQS